MADHKFSVAVSLLVFSLLCFLQVNCQQSGFRVFRTGAELREFRQFTARERLDNALMFPGGAIIEITGANQAAIAQEDTSLYLDCLPWLRRFPGGSIAWYQIQLDEFGNPTGTGQPQVVNPTPPGSTNRIQVGGPLNRWLNITEVEVVGGAEDPDSRIFQCEVCIGRGTPFQMCHTANYTNQVVGSAPRINETDTSRCIPGPPAGNVGEGAVVRENIPCTVMTDIPQPVPPPTLAWFRDGRQIAFTQQSGTAFDLNEPSLMGFLMENPILMNNVFSSGGVPLPAFQILTSGEILFSTEFDNITDPMLGNLAPGTTLGEARNMIYGLLLANWTCVANSSLGVTSVENVFRMCGDGPVIPDCTAGTGSNVLFPDDGGVVAPGCDICIQQGTSVTLNCTVSAGTPPISYSWTMNGVEVSRNPRLVVTQPGNYSCSASNLDNAPVVEASVLLFSSRATLTSRIVGRSTDGCERLRITEEERAAFREDFDTCIFVGETLEVSCTSTNSSDMLALRGADGTMYDNGTARFEVTSDTFDAANTTFFCAITNAPGTCGGFEFETSVVVYAPARIDRLVGLGGGMDIIGAGREEDVVVGPNNLPVTLRCPTSGITEETTGWRRVIEDSTGCLVEEPITMDGNGFTISNTVTGPDNLDDTVLTILNFNASFEGTYVCRTENIAGVDSDVVSLVTGLGVPEWRTTSFSNCTMMCQDGVRNRSVTCRNSRDNLLIANFMCQSDIRPTSSEQCSDLFPLPCFLDPVWIPYPWSRCSQDCKGTRSRDVPCQIPRTGEIRPNYECHHIAPRPTRSEVCEDKCCYSDVYPSICSTLGTGYCGLLVIQRLCCWTCGLTVIP